MKISNVEENFVHILDSLTDSWSVLENIANLDQKEAFYVCDIDKIVQRLNLWKSVLPRVKPYFAVKCNNNAAVLGVLAAFGTGFKCTTKNDISQVLEIGANTDDVIFSNYVKSTGLMKHVENSRVQKIMFDSVSELNKIKKLYPDAELLIGIKYDSGCTNNTDLNLGCDSMEEVYELLNMAKCLNLNVIGINFHVQSGYGEPECFFKAMAKARDIFDYGFSLGFNFKILDIGNVFPENQNWRFTEIFTAVEDALEVYFPDDSVQIIAEPSSFLVNSAFTLACNIRSMRIAKDSQSETHHVYYIDDGVYGSFNRILYNNQSFVAQPLIRYSESSKLYSSSIWGPTCDGLDQVVENIMLPEMKIGDWLIFENMGAYTLPTASSFSGFPTPKVHIVVDEKTWIALKDVLPLMENNFLMESISPSIKEKNENFSFRMPMEDIILDNLVISFGLFEETD